MVSDKFRHQLRQEIQKWEAEGLITAQLSAQLALRYELRDLERTARNRFVMILVGLGSILLGLAVITFVAANWQVWSRELKVVLLMSLFAGANIAGFYLWRDPAEGWRSLLGKGLLLLGGLILGANLALMSQMFHQSGPVYQLYLVWGVGVVTMAYSLRLTLLAILAVILTAIGYTWGIEDLLTPGSGFFQLVLEHMPLLASFLFLPLAYWCGSSWLFGLGTVLAIFSFQTNLIVNLEDFHPLSGVMAAIASVLVPAILWAYRDLPFDKLARNLAILFLGILFYLFSFNSIWESSPSLTGDDISSHSGWLILVDAFVFFAFALFSWWRLVFRRRLDLTSAAIGIMIVITGFLVWWQVSVDATKASATVIFNLFLFLLAVGLVRSALFSGKRRGFWTGIVLIVLQLFSRMVEYDTGLLFKAIVLFLCGVGVIFAGLWFERYLQSFKREVE